jgi:hypothetical protein
MTITVFDPCSGKLVTFTVPDRSHEPKLRPDPLQLGKRTPRSCHESRIGQGDRRNRILSSL